MFPGVDDRASSAIHSVPRSRQGARMITRITTLTNHCHWATSSATVEDIRLIAGDGELLAESHQPVNQL